MSRIMVLVLIYERLEVDSWELDELTNVTKITSNHVSIDAQIWSGEVVLTM